MEMYGKEARAREPARGHTIAMPRRKTILWMCNTHTIRRFILTRDSISPFFRVFSLAIHCVLFTAVCAVLTTIPKIRRHTYEPKRKKKRKQEISVDRE